MRAHRRRLVFWAKSKRLKEPPAEPTIVTGLAQRVSHTREARVQIESRIQTERVSERRYLPVIVALQDESGTKGDFNKSHFQYDKEREGYVCPRGDLLRLQTKLKPTTGKPYPIEVYRCRNKQCPVREQCSSAGEGRTIQRTPYEDAMKRQAQKQSNPAMKVLLSLRKEIVERIFGIIKTINGFRRFTVRGIEKTRAQWALACSAVNLRKMHTFWLNGRLPLRV